MKNKSIKILDCTLRDGGYVNNWNFGFENIKFILDRLNNSRIDFIEVGFLTDEKTTKNQSLYENIDKINNVIPKNSDKEKFFAMISYGKFNPEKLPKYSGGSIRGIRFIFKKQNLNDALGDCKKIIDKGYKLFINPTFINQYNKTELIELVRKVNRLSPYGFTIVDSTGGLKNTKLLEIFKLIDSNLNKKITICLHTHDNLMLSFKNAQTLIQADTIRPLVIDVSVSGIGRGAGNLKTEILIPYLNKNYNTNYDISCIQSIISKTIKNLSAKFYWGYSDATYLSGCNFCHPYYALYLLKKNGLPYEILNKILKSIPDAAKNTYDGNLIAQLLHKYTKNIKPDKKNYTNIF